MDTHVRTLGLLNILLGIIGGLAGALALISAGGIRGLYMFFDARMAGVIITTVMVLHVVTAIPSLIGGIWILQYKGWARVLLMMTSALNALTFPVGTAIGIYGLWVLTAPEVDPLFYQGPAALHRHR